jgi:DNA-directed RNA polymerase subunit RPC12/RpoP
VTYTFSANHKEEFKMAVCNIVRRDVKEMAEKNRLITEVTDAYIYATGERPENSELDELSSWAYFGYKGLTNRKKTEIKVSLSTEYKKARAEGRCNYCGSKIPEGNKAHFDREYIVICGKCKKEGVR